ncbi:hypothetical protein [Methanosarcina siciliae]|uniref:hypothetical protein n=1 Tax=Methanosarcina siciliae TaxID=38027 RepID=UPI0012E00554|nr:hypothetical protein [Methanosarcina siciliae]
MKRIGPGTAVSIFSRVPASGWTMSLASETSAAEPMTAKCGLKLSLRCESVGHQVKRSVPNSDPCNINNYIQPSKSRSLACGLSRNNNRKTKEKLLREP